MEIRVTACTYDRKSLYYRKALPSGGRELQIGTSQLSIGTRYKISKHETGICVVSIIIKI